MDEPYQRQILDYINQHLLYYSHWKEILPSTISQEILLDIREHELDVFHNRGYSLQSPNNYIEALVFEHVNQWLYQNYKESVVFEKDIMIDVKTMIATSSSLIQRPIIQTPSKTISGFKEPITEGDYVQIARFERELTLNRSWEKANNGGGIVCEGLLPCQLNDVNPLLPNTGITHHIWTNTFYKNNPFIQGFYGKMNSIEAPYVLWMNSELLSMLGLTLDDYKQGLQALNKQNEIALQFRQWRSKFIDKGSSFVGMESNIAKLEGCDLILRKDYYDKLKEIIPQLCFFTDL
ncbi:hypothetical protein OXI21_07085 [Ignatzschineria sp. RMDPL8A]|uniref:hypothetical protein n=1 Tax=Ignatzschineria sp. RMDPL8A TaxID=2999236 RepID=UPI00244676AB|nr:hypothetical protein [Ignatzschineria sp. RMDPL8A]MDG9730171.1 hypothetical protein [Ignatzschineria sp. RMDPL8A]